jgi:hypothetical protein
MLDSLKALQVQLHTIPTISYKKWYKTLVLLLKVS